MFKCDVAGGALRLEVQKVYNSAYDDVRPRSLYVGLESGGIRKTIPVEVDGRRLQTYRRNVCNLDTRSIR